MKDNRPNLKKSLEFINKEEDVQKRGKLKIFFGMSPGVGKTYTMLHTAQSIRAKGTDVVAGYVETHDDPETNILLDGLESIPSKKVENKGVIQDEMDLDAIILRHPYLVLIDGLEHINAVGSRHAKRYMDVLELLDNGINVYTTLDIQNLESRTDIVAQITGIDVHEIVPDEIFESAAEVELVDITPNVLLDRLAEGKINVSGHSAEAVKSFFRKGNITALREMSLRLLADRVDKQLKNYMREKKIPGPWKSGMNLLVLIGPSKSSAKLIRWAKNLTYTMGAKLTALHVENTQVLNETQQEQLSKNIDMARQFGAEVILTSGTDLISTTLEVARRENVTHIIIGKSGKQSFLSRLFNKEDFVNRLLKESGNIDIYVIEPGLEAKQYKKKLISSPDFGSSYKEYLLATAIILGVVLLCLPLTTLLGYQVVSFVLLLTVLVLSIFFRLGPILVASALSALAWNFFFIPPTYTLEISRPEDIFALVMFFIVAFISGSLTSRVRKQEQLTRKREERTSALFHLTNELSKTTTFSGIIDASKEDIRKYFSVNAFFLLRDEEGKLQQKEFDPKSKQLTDSQYNVAQWTFAHSKKAGKFTETLSSCKYTFYPLKGSEGILGVVGFKLDKSFGGDTELFLDAFLTQISNSIERQYLSRLAKKANFLDESDRLYKTLFNSVSEELQMPVAAITNASRALLSKSLLGDEQERLCSEIFTASTRLNRLIGNLLNMSRIESGHITPLLEWCNVFDLFSRVTNLFKGELKPYKLDISVSDKMPLVQLDIPLIEQAISGLVLNSVRNGTPDTTIRLRAFYDNGLLVIQEMDRGKSFSTISLPHVFDKFYRANSPEERGFGLGLSVAKGFVEAHKGLISVENRQHGGVRFTIEIPTEVSYPENIKQKDQK